MTKKQRGLIHIYISAVTRPAVYKLLKKMTGYESITRLSNDQANLFLDQLKYYYPDAAAQYNSKTKEIKRGGKVVTLISGELKEQILNLFNRLKMPGPDQTAFCRKTIGLDFPLSSLDGLKVKHKLTQLLREQRGNHVHN